MCKEYCVMTWWSFTQREVHAWSGLPEMVVAAEAAEAADRFNMNSDRHRQALGDIEVHTDVLFFK